MDMGSEKSSCGAGIVLFNPEIDRLKENIEAVIGQVDRVVLVDNGSSNIDDIERLLHNYNVVIIKNEQNMGIARALNQICSWAEEQKYEWILTLDQDSVCRKGLVELYWKYTSVPSVGQISSNFTEDNDGVLDLTNETLSNNFNFESGCITSADFFRIQSWKEVGGFDEALFIDSVDFDISFALDEFGWKTIKVDVNGFDHMLGTIKFKKLFGRTFLVREHSAFRKYYIFRNGIYIIRKYPNKVNLHKEIWLTIKRFIYMSIFETGKKEKICAAMRGIKDGCTMKINKQWEK